MSVFESINALHAEASAILSPAGRAPSRAEYSAALDLADAATELALEAGLAGPAMETCERFQRACYDPLARAYTRADEYERLVYRRHARRTPRRDKRAGRMFAVDPGEHVVEALGAVQIGEILGRREAAYASAARRRIRWVDEVRDQPIQTVY